MVLSCVHQLAKPNVLTIGAAFYYALQHVKSE
jgi:hypothetical protein